MTVLVSRYEQGMLCGMELMIGRVVKSHGIRGEVVVEIMTDSPEVRYAVGAKLLGKQGRKQHTLTVESSRLHKGRMLVKFKEIPDRTAADTLRGTQFWAEPLEKDDEEEFYDHELIGLTVIQDGQEIGEVSGVMHGPAGEILEIDVYVEGADKKQALVPFVHAIVPEVDLESGTCTITPPEGLLDL